MCGNTTYFVPFIASISTIIGVLIGAFLARNTAFKIVDRQEKNRDYLALRNTFIPVLKILKEPGVPERQKIPTFFDDQDIAMLSFVGHLAGEAKGNFNAKWNEYTKALREWMPLAKKGDANAQYNIGVLYTDGKGVTQDYYTGIEWFRKAAKQGNALAQFSLGTMYSNGEGVAQDKVEAERWYRKAATLGYVQAQHNLANMLAKGDGILYPHQLAGRDPFSTYIELSGAMGHRHDPCVLYVLMSAQHFLESGVAIPWWKFTEQGKKLLASKGKLRGPPSTQYNC